MRRLPSLFPFSFIVSLFCVGTQNKSVMVSLIAVDGVLWQRTLAPSVCATYTMNAEVDVEIDELSSLQFVRMTHPKVFLAVIPSTDAEGLTAFDAQFP